jgi:hypothetical protein
MDINNGRPVHVMVDIETLGDDSYSVITSLAAVPFDIEHGVIQSAKPFLANIDVQSSLDMGLKVTGSTLKFWFEQKAEVAKLMFQNAKHLNDVLEDFKDWYNYHAGDNAIIWGNSPRFDLGLIEDAYRALHLKRPWNFRNERDVRTVLSYAPGVKESVVRTGEAHDPIADCHLQIECVVKANKKNLLTPVLV